VIVEVLGNQGIILTNFHVVRGAEEIGVTLSDERRLRAKLIGVDPATDLALLEIRAPGLIAATWGQSDQLQEGALVWAVGSPFGLSRTITFGIISAKDRRPLPAASGAGAGSYLQSDAAVSPGSSGGPLVDIHGHVVGINTAIVGPIYQGVSFSIPSRVARDVYRKLRTEGNPPLGWLGVALEDLNTPEGAKVRSVFVPGSPAQRAGVQKGDIVVKWNGNQVDSRSSLQRLVAKTDIGAAVDMVVIRGGQEQKLRVQVGARPLHLY
jgi:serine protease Do